MTEPSKTLFLLEDDTDLQELLAQWLQSCGYCTVSFSSCQSTAEALEKTSRICSSQTGTCPMEAEQSLSGCCGIRTGICLS